ncbi:MAG: iron chelate uptake ABC transporter family permease subunit, partial [Iodobacter sp.]
MTHTRLTPLRLTLTLLSLAALLLLTVMISMCFGSTSYRPWQLLGQGPDAALARDVVMELRLPRTLAAVAVGGLLALAGALQQVLLRNPLADPYILGTSGGASVGA